MYVQKQTTDQLLPVVLTCLKFSSAPLPETTYKFLLQQLNRATGPCHQTKQQHHMNFGSLAVAKYRPSTHPKFSKSVVSASF